MANGCRSRTQKSACSTAGFIFGDGVYECVPVINSRPYRLDSHLTRLDNSCKEIGLKNPTAMRNGPNWCWRPARRNGPGDQVLAGHPRV